MDEQDLLNAIQEVGARAVFTAIGSVDDFRSSSKCILKRRQDR